jgi:uncharacterized protein YbjT (DUF2867 family)
MAHIAILGATGFVGTALTLRLLDLGHSVTALSRAPEKWPLQHNNLKVLRGDIATTLHLEDVLKGADCAYYLVHGLAEEEGDFEYLGGLGPDEDLSAHLRSRHLVGEILGLIPGASIEFRASIVLGPLSTSFEMLKALSQRLPVRPFAPWLETPCQPIALEDLLAYLLAALDVQVIGHTVVEIGAPEVIPYGELLDLVYKIEEVSRPKFLLPAMDQRVMLPLIDLVLPEFANVGKKLFLSLSHPTVVTDTKAEELFPDIQPRSLEDAMREALRQSQTTYPAVWEGDFWKEVAEHTKLQTRQGQNQLLEKIKTFTAPYQEKIMNRLPRRKKNET